MSERTAVKIPQPGDKTQLGEVVAVGCHDGEGFFMAIGKYGTVSLIPLTDSPLSLAVTRDFYRKQLRALQP